MGVQDLLRNHPAVGGLVGGAAIGVTGAGIVNVIGGAIKKRRAKKKTTTKRASTTKRKTCKTTRKSTKSKRSTSSKKIKHTKNGQPYIILPSGKARFISKKSEKLRKKRKGGYR